MDNKDIFNTLYLENTRVLYDFMEELSNRIFKKEQYEGYIGKKSLLGRKAIISEKKNAVNNLLNECYCKTKMLHQNPLRMYLEFYQECFCDPTYEEEKERITEMLNYFNILEYLTNPDKKERIEKFDSLPYIFEDLCISIKNMTKVQTCYLVYQKESEASQLISHSEFVVAENAEELFNDMQRFSSLNIGSVEFDLLIKANATIIEDKSFKIKQIMSLTKTEKMVEVRAQSSNETKQYFLIFDFLMDLNVVKSEYKRHFYIILDLGKENKEDEKIRKIALRILFLRNRLCEAVRKHYTKVLNFRFYCNYIQSVAEDNDRGNILHITDLHLKDNKWKKSKAWEDFLYNLTGKKIDLLAITGDIVDASPDASTAQKRYKYAAEFLIQIVKILWGEDKKNLPHDWKRRILITTGNHDYAAMNDMIVQTASRKITTGLPGNQLGGTMSKYAYFIEFLSYFLDAPTKKLLKNDFNDIRVYDKLDVIVGIFNSCSKANSLQNNKVSFDLETLKLVLEASDWNNSKHAQKSHFILNHYDQSYKIDYFQDKYQPYKHILAKELANKIKKCPIPEEARRKDSFEMTPQQKKDYCTSKCQYCIYYIYDKYIEALKSTIEYKIKDMNEKDKNISYENFLEKCEFLKRYEFLVNKDSKEEIYRDMNMLYRILKEPYYLESNEYANQYLSNSHVIFKMMKDDDENFKVSYKEIKGDKDLKYCGLAGHKHKEEYDSKNKTFIGGKFFDDELDEKDKSKSKEVINFEIISRNGEKILQEPSQPSKISESVVEETRYDSDEHINDETIEEMEEEILGPYDFEETDTDNE